MLTGEAALFDRSIVPEMARQVNEVYFIGRNVDASSILWQAKLCVAGTDR